MRVAVGAATTALAVVAAALGAGSSAATPVAADYEAPPWVPGEILVRFEKSVPSQTRALVHRSLGGRVESSIDEYRIELVATPPGLGVDDAVARYLSSPLVDVAEPNFLRYPLEIPNDDLFDELWGLHNRGQRHEGSLSSGGTPDADIDAPGAWDVEEGNVSTVVAVADTGVAVDHRDLDGSIWDNPGEVPGDGIDNDSNGYVDDVHGWDFAEEDNGVVERRRHIGAADHGTHVAGTIAAEKGNGVGVAGVCPGCRIMVLKISRAVPQSDPVFMNLPLSALLEGLAYAQQNGADVLNASFGFSTYSQLERDAFGSAVEAGVLPVIAAGNSRLNIDRQPSFPAAYDIPGTIAVAASDDRDRYAGFTSYGAEAVDLAAPGEEIVSTVLFGGYESFSGTSMATPHTVGVAGLVKSQHPAWSPVQIRNALLNSVDEPEELNSHVGFGRFTQTGGRLNAKRALAASPERTTVLSDGTIRGSTAIGHSASGGLTWPEDVNDVYRTRLSTGRNVKVVLKGSRSAEIYVWKPATSDLWQWERGCNRPSGECRLVDLKAGSRRKKIVSFTAREDGEYYFHVSYGGRTGTHYELRVRRL